MDTGQTFDAEQCMDGVCLWCWYIFIELVLGIDAQKLSKVHSRFVKNWQLKTTCRHMMCELNITMCLTVSSVSRIDLVNMVVVTCAFYINSRWRSGILLS